MIRGSSAKRLTVLASCVALTLTGCSFQGLNSLPLPGAVGRGPDAVTYHVEVPNVATLESNSPVMIDDVVVGSVGKMTLHGWHVDVEVSLKPNIVVPANAVATVGQTSLLGSMHVALDPPPGQAPSGRLKPGATIGLNSSSTYPSTDGHCRPSRRSSTVEDWARSATSSTTSTPRCPGGNTPSAI
jgi:phospholipid/cholesterol/gamma-HCH transport system substrate-binding protein